MATEELTPSSAPAAPAIAPVAAAVDTTGTAALAADDTAGSTRTALGGSDGADAGAEGPAGFPENWREMLAGDDAKELARLKRMSAPGDLHKAYRALEKKLSSGQTTAALPDDATPEEIAAHRKALGIPDKADGYALAFPAGWNVNDADKAGLAAFQEYAHAKSMTPAATEAAFEFYAQHMAAGQAAREEATAAANQDAIAELRGEYRGSEFKRNMKIAEDFLAKHFDGEEQALDEVLNSTLPNGVKVKNYPAFVKGLVRMARSYADEEALIGGDGAGGGKSMDDEYKDLINKSATPGQKLTATEQTRLMQIAEARAAREAKQGRARAA